MKKFVARSLLICSLFLFYALLAILIDPYNVFHYQSIRDNGVTPAYNYIKMRYLLDNPKKFDALLFGNSRVSYINIDRIAKNKWYNMTYSLGTPNEHLQNIQVLIQNKIIPQVIMVGIDEFACHDNPTEHIKDYILSPYPVNAVTNKTAYPLFLSKYLSPVVLLALPIIISHKSNNLSYQKQFYANGAWFFHGVYDDESLATDAEKIYWQNVSKVNVPPFTQTDKALDDVQSIINLCEKHKIKLILFTNPMHTLTYTSAVNRGYIDFLEKLSDMYNFYNFSSINDVTTNNNNYFETMHYKSNVGNLIVDNIFNGIVDEGLLYQGFGVYVTEENRSEFIKLLKSQYMHSY
jgi:hypothetical protein